MRLGQTAPLVSIISVVYRDREATRLLIDNLAPFRGSDLEIVFIDGGSTDGTVELLGANEDRVDYWMSEPDEGIYDAMNKGLNAARGQWVLHINGGDELLSVPYERLRALGEGAEMLACRVEHPEEHFTFIPRMNWTFRYQSTIPHQGIFYRREAHRGYDPKFRVLGDIAATQRMVRDGHRVELLQQIVGASCGWVGVSAGERGRVADLCERELRGSAWAGGLAVFLKLRRVYRSLRSKMG